VLSQTRKNKNEFIWKNIKSVEELGKTRKNAMEQFLADLEILATEKYKVEIKAVSYEFQRVGNKALIIKAN
jgi:hypothetical protein